MFQRPKERQLLEDFKVKIEVIFLFAVSVALDNLKLIFPVFRFKAVNFLRLKY